MYEDSLKVIAGGVNSPVRSFKEIGISPIVVESGSGDKIIDTDGNSYIDYCMSWGTLMLGHAHPSVVQAATERMRLGSSFGAITPGEEKLASAIIRQMPSIEKLRFVSSGTEATMSALRLARGYTGKKKIIKFIGNFHGHCDPLLVQAGSGLSLLNPQSSSKGVPSEMVAHTLCLPYNDVELFRAVMRKQSDIAAVIFEPIVGNMGVVAAEKPFIHALREETRRAGALLIADEVITGFRVGLSGAQGLFGFEADLTCLAKIIGGGFPVGAFGGRREIMDELAPIGEVYQGGTLSGNPVTMAAGLAVLAELEKKDFYENLQKKADRLTHPIREKILKENLSCCLNQVGSMITLFFGPRSVKSKEDLKQLDSQKFKDFFIYLFERGVYMPPSQYEAWFISSAHTDEHLDYTRELILQFLDNQ